MEKCPEREALYEKLNEIAGVQVPMIYMTHVTKVILHSFTHLGEEKADPDKAQALLGRVQKRLENADYSVVQTPYGYFLDLSIEAPGHPLARVYKEF